MKIMPMVSSFSLIIQFWCGSYWFKAQIRPCSLCLFAGLANAWKFVCAKKKIIYLSRALICYSDWVKTTGIFCWPPVWTSSFRLLVSMKFSHAFLKGERTSTELVGHNASKLHRSIQWQLAQIFIPMMQKIYNWTLNELSICAKNS